MISIYSRKILRFLAFFVLGLTLVNVMVQSVRFLAGYENLLGIGRLFDVNNENNIPAWYSSITLLLCSLLLWLIFNIKYHRKDEYAPYWKGLSIIFLLLSLDEATSIHELLIPFGNLVHATGFFFFIWVIPGMIFVSGVALVYLKFLMALPAKIRYLFLLAGSIYVLGSVGFEMIGGYYYDVVVNGNQVYASGLPAFSMAMVLAAEELLEMIGTLVFIYALLLYIDLDLKEVRLCFYGSTPERSFTKKLKDMDG